MLAVYLAAAPSDLFGLVLTLGIMGGLSALATGKARKLILVLMVLVALGLARQAMAQPYCCYCDPFWRWMGWC